LKALAACAAIMALLLLASCAGTTTGIGLTTNQDAVAAEKHP
jgi:hypothetical protein